MFPLMRRDIVPGEGNVERKGSVQGCRDDAPGGAEGPVLAVSWREENWARVGDPGAALIDASLCPPWLG